MLKIFKRRSIVLRVSHVNPFTAEKRLHEILGKRPINFEEVFEPISEAWTPQVRLSASTSRELTADYPFEPSLAAKADALHLDWLSADPRQTAFMPNHITIAILSREHAR